MSPAEKIDAIIKAQGLSRRQVAIKANIPPSTFQSAMERKKNMSTDMLQKIAKALDISLSDLLWEGEGPIPDDASILMIGPQGIHIVDENRHNKISMRKFIQDETALILKNLNYAELDDLYSIFDHLLECTNILRKRKFAIQNTNPNTADTSNNDA